MPLTYSASFGGGSSPGVSISAAQDLFFMAPSITVPFTLNRLSISTSGLTTPSSAVISLKRLVPTVTAGSGGTLIGAASLAEIAQYTSRPASTTVRINDTTRASSTVAAEIIWIGTMQDLNNLDDILVPELWPFVPGNCALVVGLEQAPTAATMMYGTAQFTELT